MPNLNCEVVRDLLPLYTEELTSRETTAQVEEHLETCKDCAAYCAAIKEEVPLKMENTVKKDRKIIWRMRIKILWNLFWPLLCVVALLFGFWERLYGLYWIILIAISTSSFAQISEAAFDDEFRREYYKRKSTPFEQVFFIVLPLLLPVAITSIPWMIDTIIHYGIT